MEESFGKKILRGKNIFILFLSLCISPASANEKNQGFAHGIAMHGDLKYSTNFKHFDYADPSSIKNGSFITYSIGTFDSLNNFILKGVGAEGLWYLHETLMTRSTDEPFSLYGLVAEGIKTPKDRSWVVFKIRSGARFHDGKKITTDDVIFSFKTLTEKGHPFYKSYFRDIENVEKITEKEVKFTFKKNGNRELPLIIAEGLPILSKDYWSKNDFTKASLNPPIGSGPYKIKKIDPGRSITYERYEDYWAKNLPINRGKYNFNEIRFDYYRDQTVAMEAFKAGSYDFRFENQAKSWAINYSFPAKKNDLVVVEEIEHEQPTGMQGFAFNTRKEIFKDRRVREALAYAFDFEWSNRNLFFGAYTRTNSYFSNSELASSGLPSEEELEILIKYKNEIPKEVLTKIYKAPSTENANNLRQNLRKARRILKEAGWVIKDGILTNKNLEQMKFEILLFNPQWERIAGPFKKNLERLGVKATIRTIIDSSQIEKRQEQFDFDMIVVAIGQSLSPGNEQKDLWSSTAANTSGSRNYMGIQSTAVDELIENIISTPNRKTLVNNTRALDRILLWGHYVIPHWHIKNFRVAYWNKFEKPKISPKYDLGLDFWWISQKKEENLEKKLTHNQSKSENSKGEGQFSSWALFSLFIAVVGFLIIRNRKKDSA